MDVRAGMKAHHASPAGAVTREKQFKGRRDAKKEAYAADEQARVARAEARAAEEQAQAEARAAEKQARAEALAAQEKARAELAVKEKALAEARADTTGQALADACVEIKFRTPHAHWLISTQVALSGAGGRVGYFARRAVAARTVDAVLEAKGPAGVKKVKERKLSLKTSDEFRKRAKEAAEALVQEEAQLMKRAAGFLVDLGRGGSTVLDDDGAGAFPEDEERIKALDAAKIREQDEKKRKTINISDSIIRRSSLNFEGEKNNDAGGDGKFAQLKELKDMRKIDTVKVATKYNASDLLTKCHERARFKELCDIVMGKTSKALGGIGSRAH